MPDVWLLVDCNETRVVIPQILRMARPFTNVHIVRRCKLKSGDFALCIVDADAGFCGVDATAFCDLHGEALADTPPLRPVVVIERKSAPDLSSSISDFGQQGKNRWRKQKVGLRDLRDRTGAHVMVVVEGMSEYDLYYKHYREYALAPSTLESAMLRCALRDGIPVHKVADVCGTIAMVNTIARSMQSGEIGSSTGAAAASSPLDHILVAPRRGNMDDTGTVHMLMCVNLISARVGRAIVTEYASISMLLDRLRIDGPAAVASIMVPAKRAGAKMSKVGPVAGRAIYLAFFGHEYEPATQNGRSRGARKRKLVIVDSDDDSDSDADFAL